MGKSSDGVLASGNLTEGIDPMSSSIVEFGSSLAAPCSLYVRSASGSAKGGREYNEDRCYRCDTSGFYLVVDGMGGHRGGSLASQIAIEKLPIEFGQRVAETKLSRMAIRGAFIDAVNETADEMRSVARDHAGYEKMGCTLGAVSIVGDRMYFGHIGDCRIYLLHRHRMKLLTKDETLVQGLVDAHVIKASDARTHRWRHIVTNSLSAQGVQDPPKVLWTRLRSGDRVLITSDGLTDALLDSEIEHILDRNTNPKACVGGLIEAALQANARDNITCVVIES